MPIPVQLALQGGGAKFVQLLAAAEAVRAAETAGQIKVTRIAGTSAGAIVGAFLAAGCDLARIRADLSGSNGQKLLNSFQLPKKPFLLWKMFWGIRFWDDKPLKDWIKLHLNDAPDFGDGFTFQELKDKQHPELVVTITNLNTCKRHEPEGTSDVVQSVLASAALPFCFRTWTTTLHECHVDGGLCKNLPIDTLAKGRKEYGRVIGFSFPVKEPQSIQGIKNFAFALLDAAITDSIVSARAIIGKDNVYELGAKGSTSIDTFDFPMAFEYLAGRDYGLTQQAVAKWLTDFSARAGREDVLTSHGKISSDHWNGARSEDAYRMMVSVGKIYESVHLKQQFYYRKMRVFIKANSLSGEKEEGFGKWDEVYYQLELEAHREPVTAVRLFLSSTTDQVYTPDYHLTVESPSGPVPHETLGAVLTNKAKTRALIVNFLQPLIPGGEKYTVTLRDQGRNVFQPLFDNQTDTVNLDISRSAGQIGCIEIILAVPRNFRPFSKGTGSTADFSPMAERECGEIFANGPGYRLCGWKACDVPKIDRATLELV